MKISNAQVFIDGTFHPLEVQVQDGLIAAIAERIDDPDAIDAQGAYLYPGGIDAHIHGGFGRSFYENGLVEYLGHGEEQVREICERLPRTGVTSVIATLGADTTLENLGYSTRCIRAVRREVEEGSVTGADPFLLHYEGPFTNPDQHTCYNPEYTQLPTRENTLVMTDGDLSDVALINVAPEAPGAMEWIRWVTGEGVHAEVCYTHCTSDQVREAADNGLDQTSHLYNCFQPMHHRINGPVIGALLDDRIDVQLTCDNHHVASDWIKLAIRLKGIDHCYGITDMTCMSGLSEGRHTMPYYGSIVVKDGTVTAEDGTICGGDNTWDKILKLCAATASASRTRTPRACTSRAPRSAWASPTAARSRSGAVRTSCSWTAPSMCCARSSRARRCTRRNRARLPAAAAHRGRGATGYGAGCVGRRTFAHRHLGPAVPLTCNMDP